jgi:hypothetical protein
MPFTRQCLYCNQEFTSKKSAQRFCNQRCSTLHHPSQRRFTNDGRQQWPNVPLAAEDAYLLGLVLTDGSVVDTPHQSRLALVLHAQDADAVQFARQRIAPQAKVTICETTARLYVSSRRLITNLRAFGIVPNKSATCQYPQNIPIDLARYFILGLMDGDGSWGVYNNREGYQRKQVAFYGTKDICQICS